MQKITFLLIFLFFGTSFGQHTGSGDCILQPNNKAWVKKFKQADTQEAQIELIVGKIIGDAYFLEKNLELAANDNGNIYENNSCTANCSFRFGLVYSNKKGIILNLKKNPEFEDLIFEFTAGNINSIDLNEYQEKDLYNPAALQRYGIVLYTEDKELKKKIKKAIKEGDKS